MTETPTPLWGTGGAIFTVNTSVKMKYSLPIGERMQFEFPAVDLDCPSRHPVEAVISGDFEAQTWHYDGCVPDVEIQSRPECECLGSDEAIRERIIKEIR